MKINFAQEYEKFKVEQRELHEKYLSAGMTEEQINAVYSFDKQQLARDLAYRRRKQESRGHTELSHQLPKLFYSKYT